MTTTALIDGDVLCYRFGHSHETVYEGILDDEGNPAREAHWEEAEPDMLEFIEDIRDFINADEVVMCLSDTKHNWRKDLYPAYKENRADVRKPLLWPTIREYLETRYVSYVRPSLEGDDVMGILATHPRLIPGDKVIVSIDKDMQTIPGFLYNPDKDLSVREISPEAAHSFHMQQVLEGDAVDNYPGCRGVGPTKAREFIQDPFLWVPVHRELTRGPNKGSIRTTWTRDRDIGCSLWEGVVSHYHKAGLTEEDALLQARIARICHHTDFNFKTKEVIPWTPY